MIMTMPQPPRQQRAAHVIHYQPTARPPLRGLNADERQRLERCLTREIMYPARDGGVQEEFVRYGWLRRQLARLLRRAAGRRLLLAEARAVLALAETVEQQRNKLIEDNWPLAKRWAADRPLYWNGNVDPDETLDVTTERLITLIDRFDPSLGFRFSTYGSRGILSALYRAYGTSARDPGNANLQPDARRLSAYGPGPPEIAIDNDLKRLLPAMMASLAERDRQIVMRRVCGPETLDDLAREHGLSRERVCQIVNTSLAKLRRMLEAR